MLLLQEFTHDEINKIKTEQIYYQFLNNAVKFSGVFAYAKNGLKLRYL